MHVTSDYYRGGEHTPEQVGGLVERWNRSLRNAQKRVEAEPLSPSRSTLRRLARHYQENRSLKRSA